MLPAATASLLGPLLTAWALLPFAQGQTPNYTRPVFLCGGDVTGESGYVASEGFPNLYPPNKECIWTITVPEGQTVSLSFRVFDFELHPACRYDALEVFAGSGTSGQRLGRFCGTFRPAPLVAPGNQVTLRMTADEGTGGRGFLLWYSGRATSGTEHQFCGGRLEKAQGTLTTPNWPESDYPPGISCSWHIIAPPDQVISLTFGKFDLEPDTYCRYDSVSVFNGAVSDDAKRLGKFCGDTAPGPISSEGNELLVQFVSDLSVTADGFSASYKTLPRGAAKGEQAQSAGEDARSGTPILSPGPKPGLPSEEKPKASSEAQATPGGPDVPSVPCPKQCRRTGTLQSNFCTSNLGKKPHLPALLVQQLSPPSGPQIPPPGSSPELASSLLTAHPHSPTVVTATVKSMVRGPGEGLTVTVSLIGAYKTGGLDLPSPLTDTPLKFYVPCKQCPPMKKGVSYLMMGQVEENRGPTLPPESFVVLYRSNQDQILTNLSKRKCPSQPVRAAGSQA
ncbi:procollagen C-endopeptidase enhancer 1 isoform X1 [Leopardus geoffroyi]|uniref:procollagen C-endopeptidase enhancer 1 isoform X1 n=1 Tax=Leopardus geoffroyi TaxID=46844 RepID=UPI001E25E82A|nr:procollagen C-endopeptidase enhancer 1 isoform X1 [Leopardus geoffroyi]